MEASFESLLTEIDAEWKTIFRSFDIIQKRLQGSERDEMARLRFLMRKLSDPSGIKFHWTELKTAFIDQLTSTPVTLPSRPLPSPELVPQVESEPQLLPIEPKAEVVYKIDSTSPEDITMSTGDFFVASPEINESNGQVETFNQPNMDFLLSQRPQPTVAEVFEYEDPEFITNVMIKEITRTRKNSPKWIIGFGDKTYSYKLKRGRREHIIIECEDCPSLITLLPSSTIIGERTYTSASGSTVRIRIDNNNEKAFCVDSYRIPKEQQIRKHQCGHALSKMIKREASLRIVNEIKRILATLDEMTLTLRIGQIRCIVDEQLRKTLTREDILESAPTISGFTTLVRNHRQKFVAYHAISSSAHGSEPWLG